MNKLLYNFYTTERKSIILANHDGYTMADGGGAFGFDIHYALEVDYILKKYKCDAIIETGTHAGDTTEYLAKQYPNTKILTCEINEDYYGYAKDRLKQYPNVECHNISSEIMVKETNTKFDTPFYYLDAHWYDYWPIKDEAENIKKGIVNIADAKTHNNRYAYDVYKDVATDINLVYNNSTKVYYNNSKEEETAYEYPCHNFQRRAGRIYYGVGITKDHFKNSSYFIESSEANKQTYS